MGLSNADAFEQIKNKFKNNGTVEEVLTPVHKNIPEQKEEVDSKEVTEKESNESSNQLNNEVKTVDESNVEKKGEELDLTNVVSLEIEETDDPVFKYRIKIRDKVIEFRKWKVKDRKNFSTAQGALEKRKALVYNCLKDPEIALDNEEYNFILEKIRAVSIKDEIGYNLQCSNCGKEFSLYVNINDVTDCAFSDYHPIEVEDIKIELQDVKNRDFYESAMKVVKDINEKYITDFALHIKSINDNNSLSFQDVVNFILDLDIDIYEEIFKQWDLIRFKCVNLQSVVCPHCNKETIYNFNDFPGFFPKSWN